MGGCWDVFSLAYPERFVKQDGEEIADFLNKSVIQVGYPLNNTFQKKCSKAPRRDDEKQNQTL